MLKINKSLVALSLTAYIATITSAFAKDAVPVNTMSPLQLVQSGRYVQALPAFKKMAAQSPGDPSINYYLGLCAMSAREYDLAEASFCKVVAGTPPASPFVPLAQRQLLSLPHKYAPQCALTNGKLWRWQRGQNVKIYVSDGRCVPNTGNGTLNAEQYAQAADAARNRMASQPVLRGYQSGDQALVCEAIKAWDWAVREKLFSYTFVRDPRAADVIVMYTDHASGHTLYPFVSGQPVLSWASIGGTVEEREPEAHASHVRIIMAHEFGHCFGLWHASADTDLMLPTIKINWDRTRVSPDSVTSDSDKASLRALYSLPADFTL